jgi:hypothetical protein
MAIGEGAPTRALPLRRRRGLRITVLGMLALVAVAAVALLFYRKYLHKPDERPTMLAAYRKVPPVADGSIGKNEYGAALTLTWTPDNTLAAFQHDLLDESKQRFIHNPTTSKSVDDLSMQVYAVYSDTSLFLAFRVRDQFVDSQESDRETPYQNDSVEVFIDGDGVPNDFGYATKPDGSSFGFGSSEGFQVVSDAGGRQYTTSKDFANADWKAAARRTEDGYIVEMEIPLKLIDTQDGPVYASPSPGALLNFALAVTDNDTEVRQQVTYAYLRTPKTTMAPWLGGEGAWNFGIKLEPKWSPLTW